MKIVDSLLMSVQIFLAHPVHINFFIGCRGPAIEVKTCGNPTSCDVMWTPDNFASKSCQTYMDKNTRLGLSLLPEGKQMSHSAIRLSQTLVFLLYSNSIMGDSYHNKVLSTKNCSSLMLHILGNS